MGWTVRCFGGLYLWKKRGHSAMARTYRDIAIEGMLETVEKEAMSQVIGDWWGGPAGRAMKRSD